MSVPSHGKGIELTFYYAQRTAYYTLPKLAKKLGRKVSTKALHDAALRQGYMHRDETSTSGSRSASVTCMTETWHC